MPVFVAQRALRRGNPVLYDATLAACALALFLGIYFLLAPDAAFVGVLYDNVRQVLPIRGFGALFLVKGVCATVSILQGRWLALAMTAAIGAGFYAFWAFLSVFTATGNHGLGGVSAGLWAFAAVIHGLLARSYLRQIP